MHRLIPETYARGADLPACEVAYSEAGLRVGRRPGQDGLPARLDGCMADMSRDEGGLRMHGSGVAGAVGYGEKGGRARRRFGKRDAKSLAAPDGSDQRHGIFPLVDAAGQHGIEVARGYAGIRGPAHGRLEHLYALPRAFGQSGRICARVPEAQPGRLETEILQDRVHPGPVPVSARGRQAREAFARGAAASARSRGGTPRRDSSDSSPENAPSRTPATNAPCLEPDAAAAAPSRRKDAEHAPNLRSLANAAASPSLRANAASATSTPRGPRFG